jgi:hypothetical protein
MNSSQFGFAGRALAELGPFGRRNQSTGLFASRLSTKCAVLSRHGDRRTGGLNLTPVTREAADAEDKGKLPKSWAGKKAGSSIWKGNTF